DLGGTRHEQVVRDDRRGDEADRAGGEPARFPGTTRPPESERHEREDEPFEREEGRDVTPALRREGPIEQSRGPGEEDEEQRGERVPARQLARSLPVVRAANSLGLRVELRPT